MNDFWADFTILCENQVLGTDLTTNDSFDLPINIYPLLSTSGQCPNQVRWTLFLRKLWLRISTAKRSSPQRRQIHPKIAPYRGLMASIWDYSSWWNGASGCWAQSRGVSRRFIEQMPGCCWHWQPLNWTKAASKLQFYHFSVSSSEYPDQRMPPASHGTSVSDLHHVKEFEKLIVFQICQMDLKSEYLPVDKCVCLRSWSDGRSLE